MSIQGNKRGKVMNRNAQVTIFILVAIAIVGGIVAYFAFRGSLSLDSVPKEVEPVYTAYSGCVSESLKSALEMAGARGGRISGVEYESGSAYAPFSSELNFLGNAVPYWYYVSGNGIIREKVPSQSEIEEEIAKEVENQLKNCDLNKFSLEGFEIERDEPKVKVKVSEREVSAEVEESLTARIGEVSATKTTHEVKVASLFGKLYNDAKQVYSQEAASYFLEGYALDVLRNYAPVDGVEVQCGPKIWKTREVVDEIHKALEANIGALKVRGNYYSLKDPKNKYFVVSGIETDAEVRFMYSPSWASNLEIDGEGVEQEVMIAEPVGTQEGMGVMGFCYVPYHFIYDLKFPVMVQLTQGDSFFQFPLVVIVDNNVARESKGALIESEESDDLCNTKTNELEVQIADVSLNPVDGEVSYTCFEQKCELGKSSNGVLSSKVPACLNGVLEVKSEGYYDSRQSLSTSQTDSAEVILEKSYNVNLGVLVGEKTLGQVGGTALVRFVGSNGKSVSASVPENPSIALAEGMYNLTVYIYGNSTIKIPASNKEQCYEVARSGLAGLFGSTKEECVNIEIPATTVSQALIGGGSSEVYVLADELAKGSLTIESDLLPVPKSLEELQNNIEAFDMMGVNLKL